MTGILLTFSTADTATTYEFEFDAGLNVVVVKIAWHPKIATPVADPVAV